MFTKGSSPRFIAWLKTDPLLGDKVEAIKRAGVHNQAIADYAQSIGSDLKTWLHNDLRLPQSQVQAKIWLAVVGLHAGIGKIKTAPGIKEWYSSDSPVRICISITNGMRPGGTS